MSIPAKTIYKTTNWHDYNRALRQRGSLTVWFDPAMVPLLLHRRVGVPVAIETSLKLTRKNPVTVAVWGLIIATFLIVAMIPFFSD